MVLSRLALLLALTAACAHARHDIGGTPGPPAIACDLADATCLEAQDSLESIRRNIGGWCGTTTAMAYQLLLERGPTAIPHLERALSDRDPEVAGFAASVLIDLGAGDRVTSWCAATNPTPPDCDHLRSKAAALAALDIATTWSGRHILGDDRVSLRLRRDHDALTGELCVETHGCAPLTDISRTGALLAFEYTYPDRPPAHALMNFSFPASGNVFAVCLKCDAPMFLQRL